MPPPSPCSFLRIVLEAFSHGYRHAAATRGSIDLRNIGRPGLFGQARR